MFTWHRVALSPIALTNSGTPGRTWSGKPPVFTSTRPRKSYIHSLDLSLSPSPPTCILHWEFGKTIGERLWETKPVKEEMMSQTICLPSSPPSASNANTFVGKSATHLRPPIRTLSPLPQGRSGRGGVRWCRMSPGQKAVHDSFRVFCQSNLLSRARCYLIAVRCRAAMVDMRIVSTLAPLHGRDGPRGLPLSLRPEPLLAATVFDLGLVG